jgi:hypothetical protein
VCLRNRTRNALTVICPGFVGLTVPQDDTMYTPQIQSPYIYCIPHLRDSKGKPVDVRYKLRAEDSQYTIGPGQEVVISHWMLRIMDRRAAGSPNTKKYTLVAFVAPGKHRMSCDVSAAWGGGRRALLRTGEAVFDVTAADAGQP